MVTFAVQNVVCFLAVATLMSLCQAKIIEESSDASHTNSRLWQPKEGTREEWLKCHGMPKDVCEETKIKYQQLQNILLKQAGLYQVNKRAKTHQSTSKDPFQGSCTLLTEEQIDILIAEAKKSEDKSVTRRQKKSLAESATKWSMPVPYKFDGTHDENQKSIIRNAFQHFMDNTCVRFNELPTETPFDDNHILITSAKDVCYTFVGKIGKIPQELNLDEVCASTIGTPVHEIGHALGLIHEQLRKDRDSFIMIDWSRIGPDDIGAFQKTTESDDYGLTYDYGSIMHYPGGGNFGKGNYTMTALEPLYQMNMGQSSGMSFHDRKVINLSYCQGTCPTPLDQACLRGGYQNPNNCSTCICPDGFSGQYCDQVAPAKHATCGGELTIEPGSQEVIKSPGRDDEGYSSFQECTWWLKAPEDYKLQLTFDGDFDVFCDGICLHWVEIKYKKDLGHEGGRFCCDSRPDVTIVSESNEMMVIFQSKAGVDGLRRGFAAIVKPTSVYRKRWFQF